jgi:pimeloyl-ACP methyl ester carboxylesterase
MIYFLHGNGFPAACYQQFLDSLKNQHLVFAEPLLTSALQCEPSQRWFVMRDQAVARINELLLKQAQSNTENQATRKLHLVGHSMGGYLQLMAAQLLLEQQPNAKHLLGNIVLIDSPFPLGLRGLLLKTLQATSLTYKFGPAPVAANRRDQWQSIDDASEFFREKSFTRGWGQASLNTFTNGVLKQIPEGGYKLAVDRQIESDIYAHVPAASAVEALYYVRSKGLSPYFIAGSNSAETGLAGRKKMYRLFKNQISVIEGGHLIPFEQPELCARAVMNFIKA